MPNVPDPIIPDPEASLSLPEFNAIVGSIYECVLEPDGWPAVIDRMRQAVGAKASWIALHYPSRVSSAYPIEVGTDPEQQRRLKEQYVPMSPFIGIRHHIDSPDVISVDDAVDYDEFVAGRFYGEWARPQGWNDFIMAVLEREPDLITWLGFCLPERARNEQKGLAGAFRPHVARALRISRLIEERTAQAADLAAAVEGLATGVVLVDPALTVRGINPAAERMMRNGAGPRAANGRLHPPRTEAGAAFSAAIAACAEARLERAGATILFGDEEGGLGLLAHVMPLERPRARIAKEAVAAIFLTNPTAASQTPMQAFVKRFGLTPSETRVLMALMEGKNPRAIAAAQGVSMPTVRTHLHRLYDKTGTAGQADIVRLMASVSRPL